MWGWGGARKEREERKGVVTRGDEERPPASQEHTHPTNNNKEKNATREKGEPEDKDVGCGDTVCFCLFIVRKDAHALRPAETQTSRTRMDPIIEQSFSALPFPPEWPRQGTTQPPPKDHPRPTSTPASFSWVFS